MNLKFTYCRFSMVAHHRPKLPLATIWLTEASMVLSVVHAGIHFPRNTIPTQLQHLVHGCPSKIRQQRFLVDNIGTVFEPDT